MDRRDKIRGNRRGVSIQHWWDFFDALLGRIAFKSRLGWMGLLHIFFGAKLMSKEERRKVNAVCDGDE
jgi:hypothetical protein